jgi:hypothetical protein
MGSLLKGKIRCKHCNGNFKKRKNRKKTVYLCSRVDNYGDCKRVTLSEEFLLSTIKRRYNEDLSDEELVSKVEIIIVEDELLFEIKLIDQDPIIYGRNKIVY